MTRHTWAILALGLILALPALLPVLAIMAESVGL
jgi:hypothetical protein